MKLPKPKKIPTYFGLHRVMYLQTLCNRWGDFKVSWNFKQSDGEMGFTKRRSILELWSEDYDHPKDCRLNKVMHRQAMPIEHFIEIDDEGKEAERKRKRVMRICSHLKLPYSIYKSRKGYHISVLDPEKIIDKKTLIGMIGSDGMMCSKNVTWSMEWTNHWKQKDFVLECVEHSPDYPSVLLGQSVVN